MKLEALRRHELRDLLCVPTTSDEAYWILKRNEDLLRKLREMDNTDGHVGCPHCEKRDSSHWACGDCGWLATWADPEDRYNGDGTKLACSLQTFAGTTLSDQQLVGYGHDCECLNLYYPGEETDTARLFLQAHVDWAEVVIALGGTCKVPWREMSEEERSEWEVPYLDDIEQELQLEYPQDPEVNFRVSGYWKDTLERFEDRLVTNMSFDDYPEDEFEYFMFDMDKTEIEKAMDEKDDTYEFVLTQAYEISHMGKPDE